MVFTVGAQPPGGAADYLTMRSFPLILLALLVDGLSRPPRPPTQRKRKPSKLKPVNGKLPGQGRHRRPEGRRSSPTRASRRSSIKLARRSVAWDTMQYDWQIADVDAWMAAARAAGVTPLITFARSRIDAKRHQVPTAAQIARGVQGVPRPLPVGQGVRRLQRVQPLRRADRPPPQARRRSTTRR